MKIYTEEEIIKKLNRKKMKNRIIKAIIYPIIILIFVCNIILLIQKIQNPQAIPGIFGYKSFVIVSGSMEPTITIGDMIIVKEVEKDSIKKDDIITFDEEGYQVTHRVVGILEEEEKLFQTKGDANNATDETLVKYGDIQGKYVFKISKIGLIISKIQSAPVIIVALIIIYLIYAISARKDDRKIARHEKRKEIEKNKQDKKYGDE